MPYTALMKPAKFPLNVSRRRLSGGLKRLPKPAPLPELAHMPRGSGQLVLRHLPQPTRLSIAIYGALAALALGAVTSQSTAWAQESAGENEAMGLKPDSGLRENLPLEVNDSLPTFVRSQRMENKGKTTSEFEGEVEVRRHDLVIRADKVEFDQQTSDLKASGNVLINRNGDRFTGPELQINTDTSKGYFEQPEYELLMNGAKGNASRVDFIDRDNMVVEDGVYSTCERVPGSKWMPDWILRASSIELDTAEDVGTAKGGVLEFKGVPILGAPYLTFPLSDKRKSGVLPPTINLDSTSGFEVSVPYYLNLAPNFDATLVPTVMSKRGVDLGAEVRYLEPSYTGTFKGAFMPSDRLRDQDRWAYSLQHRQFLTGPIGGGSGLGLSMHLNRVSDDNYWRDFPRSLTSLTSRLLPNDVSLGWTRGPWSMGIGAYKWQALQDPDAPFTPPFDRLPSLGVNYEQTDLNLLGSSGWDLLLQTNFTRFQRSVLVSGDDVKVGGDRSLAVANLSRRWQAPGWYVQPAAQLHMAQYQTRGINGQQDTSASRVVPTLSLDSGLVFERPAQFFGRDYVQTLEPRAFFTWTPFRDQTALPNYDSGSRDFNLATMFSTNAFNGNDRIADMRAVTVGLNSRLLDPGTGSEVVRLGLAQRYLLADQNVTLPGGAPVTERASDMLLAARVQWDPLWSFDSTVQYNPKSNESARTTVGGRYTPGPYRVFSAAYRIQRRVSEQLDLGWQWPLAALWGGATEPQRGRALGPNQWYSVGRINYSLPDRKILDLVAGFEYDAGCWLGRVVLERLQTSTTKANQRLLLQLEFDGLSRLGASSLQSLQANIPRYRYLREEVSPPSRFPQYD